MEVIDYEKLHAGDGHEFVVGDNVWYIKIAGGDEGCFPATVKSIDTYKGKQTLLLRLESGSGKKAGGLEFRVGATGEKDREGYCALRDTDFPPDGVDDMVSLRFLNDAELERNLRTRFYSDRSYCYCANTCVAINLFFRNTSATDRPYVFQNGVPTSTPFDPFCEEVKREYIGKVRGENPPHVYAIVQESIESLFRKTQHDPDSPKEQAIVITGESGAGKTFTTYKVLDFVDSLNGVVAEARGVEVDGITQKIMDTMPIMDAFGNACMPRNDDSSRFGKLYKVFFDRDTELVTGATITPYLLEKNRVCTQSSWERGFHIFYYLCAAAAENPGLREAYGVLPVHQYHFLNRFAAEGVPVQPGDPAIGDDKIGICQFQVCDKNFYDDNRGAFRVKEQEKIKVEGQKVPYAEHHVFHKVVRSLEGTGFSGEAIDQIWRLTSAVLLMGNIQFEAASLVEPPDITNPEVLHSCASLLGVDPDKLEYCLLRTMKGRHETLFPLRNALANRNALARTIYNDLFEEIIRQFSARLAPARPESDTFLGILDIFGFEFVEKDQLMPGKVMNSFEQFCINLCNEKLQNLFVRCVFTFEINQYVTEGLQITEDDFDFTPNDQTVDLLQNSKKSILAALDEIGKDPAKAGAKGDAAFHQKVERDFSQPGYWTIKGKEVPNPFQKHKRLRSTAKRIGYDADAFCLTHYAATVIYDVSDWVDKNKDQVSREDYRTLCSSRYLESSDSMLNMFVEMRDPDEAPKGMPASLGGRFRQALNSLVDDTLSLCTCSFVRCIKPNTHKITRLGGTRDKEPFDAALVLNQLQYTGMLDTLEIRRKGFPVRMAHEDFYFRFKPLFPDATSHDQMVQQLYSDGASTQLINVGYTKVLMKDEFVQVLDAQRLNKLKKYSLVAQSTFRMCLNQQVYSQHRESIVVAGAACRSVLAMAKVAGATERRFIEDEAAFMQHYMKASIRERQSESAERALMEAEEAYMEEIMAATAMERYAKMKREVFQDARTAFAEAEQHQERLSAALGFLDEEAKMKELQRSQEELRLGAAGSVYKSQLSTPYKFTYKISRVPKRDAYFVRELH